MSSDEVRLLEHRARSIEQQLRTQRIEIGKISEALHSANGDLFSSSSQFKQLKSQLLFASTAPTEKSVPEKIAETKVYAQRLTQLTAVIQRDTQQVKTLAAQKQSATAALANGLHQIEKLSDHLDAIHRKNAVIAEEKINSELEDLTSSRHSNPTSASSKTGQTHGENSAYSLAHGNPSNHTHSWTSLQTSPQFDQKGSTNDSSALSQGNPQNGIRNQTDMNPQAERSFRDALSSTMQERIEGLEKWEKLDRTGVGFKIDLGTGEKIGVEIDSHTTGGVSVRLQPDNYTEGRKLRHDRSEIITALSKTGCSVKRVSVLPCK